MEYRGLSREGKTGIPWLAGARLGAGRTRAGTLIGPPNVSVSYRIPVRHRCQTTVVLDLQFTLHERHCVFGARVGVINLFFRVGDELSHIWIPCLNIVIHKWQDHVAKGRKISVVMNAFFNNGIQGVNLAKDFFSRKKVGFQRVLNCLLSSKARIVWRYCTSYTTRPVVTISCEQTDSSAGTVQVHPV